MFNLTSISYNVEIAKKLGIYSAVFISLIDSEISCIKNTDVQIDTIELNYDYIYEKTGISINKLSEIEAQLKSLNILVSKDKRGNKGKYYKISYNNLINILNDTDTSEILVMSKKSSICQVTKKVTAIEKHIESLKNSVEFNNDLVKSYLFDWIDLIARKYPMNNALIKFAIQDLVNYAKNDFDTICKIITIAIKNTYRNMSWAIEAYEKELKKFTNNNFVEYNEIKSDGSEIVNEEF